MNCREVTQFLSDYLDGELPLRQRLTFKLHLLLCPDCRRYLQSFATTIKLTRSLGKRAASDSDPPIPKALLEAILAARGNETP
jgi:predicted anti-sigma-YlaC factor YlaD